MAPSSVKIILGAGSWGTKPVAGSETFGDKTVINAILAEFKKHGHNQLDTARLYGDGTSEELLAELDYTGQGFILDTKIKSFFPGGNNRENIPKSLNESLAALKQKKVHILYLHAPDRTTPLEETLEAIDAEYKKGKFEKFGVSNFNAQEVEDLIRIANEKGYVKPSVYQGQYNLVARAGETALFPVLRKHNISFYAYSPLGGAFLTGDVTKNGSVSGEKSRFDVDGMIGTIYRNYYFKDSYFQAIDSLKEAAAKHGITVQEIALRWIVHHSLLKGEHGDGIITGGSKLVNIKNSLVALEKPPLPADLLKLVEDIWNNVKDNAVPYSM